MGMVMRNHELFESGAYPHGFAPEVEAWREVANDIGSDTSVSTSLSAFALGDDLDPSVDLAGEAVMEDLTSSLTGLSLSTEPKPSVRFSPIILTVGAVQTLSAVNTGSNGRSVDRRSKGVNPTLRSHLGEGGKCSSDCVISVASTLATRQQFRNEDLYQSDWYREPASEIIKNWSFIHKTCIIHEFSFMANIAP
ncbi:hypothetical protein AYI68_g3029 [Smittium mucronatum]|uniref:Uncharacterized protein n=1 Tax=Smittium mucronatum TaxID=133383 RepID=A0A1R0H122_9FUNG|nr:hypothetical protein AYI68_g3029 [Smittium mucronatum]